MGQSEGVTRLVFDSIKLLIRQNTIQRIDFRTHFKLTEVHLLTLHYTFLITHWQKE